MFDMFLKRVKKLKTPDTTVVLVLVVVSIFNTS